MDNSLALIIGAVVVALLVFAIVMGKRLASGRIRLGKHIKGHIGNEATGDGSPISGRMSKDDDPYS